MGPINGRRLMLLTAVALAVAGAAVDSVTAQQGKGPDYFNPKNFNPSMAIVMVVLVTAFFLLGFFSIYLRRCAGPPLGGPDDADDEYPVGLGRRPGVGFTYASASRSRRIRGLDRAVLDSFPTMAYADVRAHKAGKGALECAVCLCEFDDDDMLRLLPRNVTTLFKALDRMTDILDECLKAGKLQVHPLQTTGTEESGHQGLNPRKNPRKEATSNEQDLHLKSQRTTGAFGMQAWALEH